MVSNQNNGKSELAKKLWDAADKLRGNVDAAEYKHAALGLIFLKYISNSFQDLHERLVEDEYTNLEGNDTITGAYHTWLDPAGNYDDEAFFARAPLWKRFKGIATY